VAGGCRLAPVPTSRATRTEHTNHRHAEQPMNRHRWAPCQSDKHVVDIALSVAIGDGAFSNDIAFPRSARLAPCGLSTCPARNYTLRTRLRPDVAEAFVDDRKLQNVVRKLQNVVRKLQNIDRKLQNVDRKLKNVDRKLQNVDRKLQNTDRKLQNIDRKLQNVDRKLQNVVRKLQNTDRKLQNVDRKLVVHAKMADRDRHQGSVEAGRADRSHHPSNLHRRT
jgi:Skp family chaperone for outer membrane proteins